jgi:hypothetical protein
MQHDAHDSLASFPYSSSVDGILPVTMLMALATFF